MDARRLALLAKSLYPDTGDRDPDTGTGIRIQGQGSGYRDRDPDTRDRDPDTWPFLDTYPSVFNNCCAKFDGIAIRSGF